MHGCLSGHKDSADWIQLAQDRVEWRDPQEGLLAHLQEGAGRRCQFINGRPWNHKDAGTSDDPAQHVGPHRVHVLLVCERLVAHQPIDDDELQEVREHGCSEWNGPRQLQRYLLQAA